METVFIYALKDPDTGQIRYVGETVDTKQRLSQHLSEARRLRGNTPRLALLRSYLRGGIKPTLVVLDEVPESEWQQWEVAYIEYFSECGCDLVNSAPGGIGTGSGLNSPMFGKKRPVQSKLMSGDKNPMFGRTGNRAPGYGKSPWNAGKKCPELGSRKRGKASWMKGKKHSEISKSKIRAARNLIAERKQMESILAAMWT